MDDWDKMVLITLLGGEQTGGEEKSKNIQAQNKKTKKAKKRKRK